MIGESWFESEAEDYLNRRESRFEQFVGTQIGGQYDSGFEQWFSDDGGGQAKRDILRIVADSPDGVEFARVARQVLGEGAVRNSTYPYQQLLDWVKASQHVETVENSSIWLYPSLNLSRQYANRKTTGRRGDGLSNGSESGPTAGRDGDRTDCPTDTGTEDSQQYPKDRAQSILDKRVQLDGRNGQDYRAGLLRQLGTEREIQEDKFKIQRAVRDWISPQYLLIPYLTRFNDTDRAGDTQDRFRTALQRASQRYQDAVVVTLTTDAKRHSSVSEALESLGDAKGRFMSWIGTDYQLGKRPDNLTVLEWTAGGLPHIHLVLFGMSWLMPKSKLIAKWDSLGAGRVVDIDDAHSRDGSDKWRLHDDDGRPVTLRYYLGKAIRGLQDVAGMDAGDLRDAVEDGDISLWRHALYWATGRQYCSCSPSLKDSGDSDGLPHVKQYEFVGVAQYRDIPAHIRRDAAILDRPPPPSRDVGQSTAS
jgi:hypothetical protein